MNRVNHAFLKYFSCFGIDDEEMLEEGFQYTDLCEDDVDSEVGMQKGQNRYLEAAILLMEGKNVEQNFNHPKTKTAQTIYLLTHRTWFYVLELATFLLIMLLSIFETPFQEYDTTCIIEITILIIMMVVSSIALLRIKWSGSISRYTTIIKLPAGILLMAAYIIFLTNRQQSQNYSSIYILLAIKPLLAIDIHYLSQMRRLSGNIISCVGEMMYPLLLLCLSVLLFGVFGYHLLGRHNENFGNLTNSTLNLFILMTTANFPDVMMPSYEASNYYPIFFIVYIILNVFILSNLMLSVACNTFTKNSCAETKRRIHTRRKAIIMAYKIVCDNEKLDLDQFQLLMELYEPSRTTIDNLLAYKVLDKTASGNLSQTDFYDFYDATSYSWKRLDEKKLWYEGFHLKIDTIFAFGHQILKNQKFIGFMYLVVILNGILVVINATNDKEEFYPTWVSCLFVAIYAVECLLKLTIFGPKQYFASCWRVLEFVLSLMAFIFDIPWCKVFCCPEKLRQDEGYLLGHNYISIIRLWRLIRILKWNKKLRNIIDTFLISFPKLISATIFVILFYYFFAVIGVTAFYDANLEDCQANGNVSYRKNSFNNIPRSFVTLFELTVVNNWHVIMECYVEKRGIWSRVYFISFYICSLVLICVITAFIIDTYIFRMEYKMKVTKEKESAWFSRIMVLKENELNDYISVKKEVSRNNNVSCGEISYIYTGNKQKTRKQMEKLLYHLHVHDR